MAGKLGTPSVQAPRRRSTKSSARLHSLCVPRHMWTRNLRWRRAPFYPLLLFQPLHKSCITGCSLAPLRTYPPPEVAPSLLGATGLFNLRILKKGQKSLKSPLQKRQEESRSMPSLHTVHIWHIQAVVSEGNSLKVQSPLYADLRGRFDRHDEKLLGRSELSQAFLAPLQRELEYQQNRNIVLESATGKLSNHLATFRHQVSALKPSHTVVHVVSVPTHALSGRRALNSVAGYQSCVTDCKYHTGTTGAR